MDKVWNFFAIGFRDIPVPVLIGLLLLSCVGVFFLLVFLGWKRGIRWSGRLLLLEYLTFILFLSFILRSSQGEHVANMIPFWSYRAILAGEQYVLVQVIMNVLAFIPVGLLFGCFLGRSKWWMALLIGGGFSVLIEILQFVFKRGMAEFDDVFHNVLGCLIGYGLYVGVTWLVEFLLKKRGVVH